MPLLALLPVALANGQTSHQWITWMALEELPDGELKDFLSDPEVHDALANGTMFPDGGYAVGDDYGEMAHWEPLQDLYLAWILANHPPPFDGEGAQHAAFFLGMRSHGMADQFYDATFMERSKAWDPPESWACCSMDEATDVAYAAAQGPAEVPPKWWPEELLPLFAEAGHAVDADTVDQGQSMLGIAIGYVGAASEYEETVASYTAEFPWACTHQVDPAVVGNPAHEARMVAAYWQVAWERLHGADGWASPLLGSVPDEGGYQSVLDHAHLDARVALVFAKGLDAASIEAPGAVTVTGSDGVEVPVAIDLFYGSSSHVVNLAPLEDWHADTDYTIRVSPGVQTWDGLPLEEPVEAHFTTRPPTEDPLAEGPADAQPACGCATVPTRDGTGLAALLALGTATRAARRRAPPPRRRGS